MSLSSSPKVIKGALIQFPTGGLIPIPNLIVFQYNPESVTRTLTTWQPVQNERFDATRANDTSQPFEPDETLTLPLELDAADALEQPDSHPVATISGVADRIAALEMLTYPQFESALSALVGAATAAISGGGLSLGGLTSAASPVPRGSVPVVLFFWGPGRIVPVRLTSFQVDEQAYSPTLYPLRAKVTVGLKILTDKSFTSKKPSAAEKIAIAAYQYTVAQKKVLAAANMANSVESIASMLPF